SLPLGDGVRGRFMESLHDFSVAHWDHEPNRSRARPRPRPRSQEEESMTRTRRRTKGRFMERITRPTSALGISKRFRKISCRIGLHGHGDFIMLLYEGDRERRANETGPERRNGECPAVVFARRKA